MVDGQNPGPVAPSRNRKEQERREQRRCQGRSDLESVRGGVEAGGAEEKPGARDGGGGAEGEDIEWTDGE